MTHIICATTNATYNNTNFIPPIKKKVETADNQDTSMENNGSKENREKGITDKAGTVDMNLITKSIKQCTLGVNPLDYNMTTVPETENNSISMTLDVEVIKCNHKDCKGHIQFKFQCKACHKSVGCNVRLTDNTRICTKCFSKNQKEYASQAIKNHKNQP
jgi:hypothetical protein